MDICLLRIPNDVECWISSYVLTDAGYNVISEHDIDMKGKLYEAWYKNQYDHPVIICSHSIQHNGLVVNLPRKKTNSGMYTLTGGIFWDHDDLYWENLEKRHPIGNRLHKLFTCYCDYKTQSPTPYINLPGYDFDLNPGYWMVTTISCSNQYRKWLGIVKNIHKLHNHIPVKKIFEQYLLPRLEKYRKQCPTSWYFEIIVAPNPL